MNSHINKSHVGRKVMCVSRTAHQHWHFRLGGEYEVVESGGIVQIKDAGGDRFPLDKDWGHEFQLVDDGKTPLQRMGLKVGDKVKVLKAGFCTKVGDILVVKSDDRTNSPFFHMAQDDHPNNLQYHQGFSHFIETQGEVHVEKVIPLPYAAVDPLFQKGDKLVVTNEGCRYTTYNKMAGVMGFDLPKVSGYCKNGDIVTVFDVRQHENGLTNLYGVRSNSGIRFLIGETGLREYTIEDDLASVKADLETVTKERDELKAKLAQVKELVK